MGPQKSYLIIGNGITGMTAAELIRAEQPGSAITIVADDPFPVYYRPALKDYLGGRVAEEKLWARPRTFYREQRIRFVPGRVVGINPVQRGVQLHTGQWIGYDELLLAHGARPRQLTCPGLNFAGVSTLRTVVDYQQIRYRLESTERVVISGSGTLAMESAETLRHLGYQVTHLLRNRTLWSEILDETASDLVLQEERRSGIDVRLEEEIAEIIGKNGQVSEVVTTRGARIACSLVLIAIGIEPSIDFVRACGIACGRGIKVNAGMCTNIPHIYAAGDVIETTNQVTGHTRVLGQWYPAIQQARIAAHSMLGTPDAHRLYDIGALYNATFLFGLDFVSIGQTAQFQQPQLYQYIVADPQPRDYRKIILQNGIPVGALLLGNRKQAHAFKRAIDHRVDLTVVAQHLFADNFKLDEWLDSQGVPPARLESESPQALLERAASPQIVEIAQQPTGALAALPNMDAYLLPLPHPKVSVTLSELRLPRDEQQIITIGRQPGSSLFIEHSSVSRFHAQITYTDGHFFLRDIGSSNGTFVNANALLPKSDYQLRHQDKMRFGDVQFHFELRTAKIVQHAPAATAAIVSSETTFLHIQDSKLYTDTNRVISQAALNALSSLQNTPALVLVTQDGQSRTVALDQETHFMIGRDQENTIVLQDSAASRRHAELFATPDGFYIRDLGSSNGVFVNKIKINNPYHLLHKDRIVIGNTLLYFSVQQPQQSDTIMLQQQSGQVRRPVAPQVTTRPVSEATSVSIKVPAAAGLAHRTETQALSPGHVQFEIDMCIGCDRCMAACPLPMSSIVSITDLNHATISQEVAAHVARFTHECIMCGSCVPVCPVDNHRDLLMLSLKQRLGVSWDNPSDPMQAQSKLPPGLHIQQIIEHLRQETLLREVPENYLLHLVAASQCLMLAPGTTIIREGEYGRDLYLVLDGQLMLLTNEADGKELPVAIIDAGEYVGEYGMLTGQQYMSTARAQTSALVLQISEQVVQRLMELVPSVRRFFDHLNSANSISSILKRMALFQGVPDADIQALTQQAQVKLYDRDERLFAEDDMGLQGGQRGRPARESLHIILEGFVKVGRRTIAGTGQNKSDERIIAYRQGGDYFAGGLDLLGDGRAVTVTSINRTRVAEIPQVALMAFFQRYPEVNQRFTMRLREYIESAASVQNDPVTTAKLQNIVAVDKEADTHVQVGLHSLVSDGVVEGTEVLLIDLDKCIHCAECEEACERRHGKSRMNRKGMVVGNISIATACRQCQDPVCMLCSRAGIARHPNGEVYITESCIGCGICAERCPYGAISIVDVEEQNVSPSSWQRFSCIFARGASKERERNYLPMATVPATKSNRAAPGPLDVTQPVDAYDELRKKIAIKCDLCAGYKDQACVEACPTGAAIRVKPTKFFGSTEEILRRRAN